MHLVIVRTMFAGLLVISSGDGDLKERKGKGKWQALCMIEKTLWRDCLSVLWGRGI